MKSLESFSENVIGFRMVHAIIGHRVYPCDLFLFIIIIQYYNLININYFTDVFRKAIEITPTEYRKFYIKKVGMYLSLLYVIIIILTLLY